MARKQWMAALLAITTSACGMPEPADEGAPSASTLGSVRQELAPATSCSLSVYGPTKYCGFPTTSPACLIQVLVTHNCNGAVLENTVSATVMLAPAVPVYQLAGAGATPSVSTVPYAANTACAADGNYYVVAAGEATSTSGKAITSVTTSSYKYINCDIY